MTWAFNSPEDEHFEKCEVLVLSCSATTWWVLTAAVNVESAVVEAESVSAWDGAAPAAPASTGDRFKEVFILFAPSRRGGGVAML